MVIILFILMVVILLTSEYFSLSKKMAVNTERHVQSSIGKDEIIERYFHKGHSWALVQPSKNIVVGIDDFAQTVIGKITSIQLPNPGALLRQGEQFVTMRHGEKALSPAAPLSGTIVEVNDKLRSNPQGVNDSPLEKGWVVKISPTNLAGELRWLLKGVPAARWQEAVRAQLVQWFSPRTATVMQDGGKIVDTLSDTLSDNEWRMLVDEFFNKHDTDTHAFHS
ncbi:MAG TPA: hypothetical protein VMM58_11755 [Bacteroidota bacterium]|nr:hypothetical protein [Bacteroidota bacterium]